MSPRYRDPLDARPKDRPKAEALPVPALSEARDCDAMHPEHPGTHCRQPDGHSGPHMTARRDVDWDNAYLSKAESVLPPAPDPLREALEIAGFEPDSNICSACGHHGGEHDGGNWCLVCPRPEMAARPIDNRLSAGWCYFASMTKEEQWAHGIDALRAALREGETRHE